MLEKARSEVGVIKRKAVIVRMVDGNVESILTELFALPGTSENDVSNLESVKCWKWNSKFKEWWSLTLLSNLPSTFPPKAIELNVLVKDTPIRSKSSRVICL